MNYLIQKGFISIEETQRALKNWRPLTPAILALFLSSLLAAFRWFILLKAQNISLTGYQTLQITFIGNFFNITLPGAVSGDFVKAYYVSQLTKHDKSRILGSLLFDRLVGVSALILVSTGAFILGWKDYFNSPLFAVIKLIILLACLGFLMFYGYLFLIHERWDPLLFILKKLELFFKLPQTPVTRLYLSLRHYHQHRSRVIQVLALSILIHLMVGWSCFIFSKTLGIHHLSLLSIYIIVPLGLLVTAIPLAPGGLGTGNMAFLYLFQTLGSHRGADIYSLFAMTQIFLGCLGGFVYLQYRKHAPFDQKLA